MTGSSTKQRRARTWAGVILALLVLPGCQASGVRPVDGGFGSQRAAVTAVQPGSALALGPGARLGVAQAQVGGYEPTCGQMFSVGGGSLALLIVFALPILFVGGLFKIFG